MDDIIIHSQIAYEHVKRICTVLSLPHRAGVTFNLNKCKFFREKVKYSRRVIRPGILELTSHTTDAILDSKSRRTVT